METNTTIGEGAQQVTGGDNKNYSFALVSLTSLFFMWGFITCLNDILIPHLKNVFALNYTQAMLIQFCFFGAYFIMSLPAGALVHRVGYKRGLVVGLLIAGVGCLLFYPAAVMRVYAFFLGALFVLATGITLLQVSANPYVAALGPVQTASSRLNLAQAFNSLGTTVAPFFGGLLILSVAASGLDHDASLNAKELADLRLAEADAVKIPYLLIAATLFGLAAIFAVLKLPDLRDKDKERSVTDDSANRRSAWQYPHLVLGATGIFVYVGAEVAIGSFLVNYIGLGNIAGLSESDAANYLFYYWGGAMVGRFVGSALMTRINPASLLSCNAGVAIVLVSLAVLGSGSLAMWAILLVGLCNSIMFPTIFSLALRGLGPATSQGSGILCLAIVGGAIVPLVQGALADAIGLQLAFIVPVFCYLYIAFYGFKGSKVRGT